MARIHLPDLPKYKRMLHPRSKWYEVVEDSVKFKDEAFLTSLWWKNDGGRTKNKSSTSYRTNNLDLTCRYSL
jgi:hypothetical protein